MRVKQFLLAFCQYPYLRHGQPQWLRTQNNIVTFFQQRKKLLLFSLFSAWCEDHYSGLYFWVHSPYPHKYSYLFIEYFAYSQTLHCKCNYSRIWIWCMYPLFYTYSLHYAQFRLFWNLVINTGLLRVFCSSVLSYSSCWLHFFNYSEFMALTFAWKGKKWGLGPPVGIVTSSQVSVYRNMYSECGVGYELRA